MRTIGSMNKCACVAAKTQARRFRSSDEGSLTIFSLFLFLLILMIAGLAVDTMRYENQRVAIQNTLDSAIVAASSLSQDMDAEALVKQYVAKAGLDPNDVSVTMSEARPDGVTVTDRRVSATANINMNTMFMGMMGIDSLHGTAKGSAMEGVQMIEIALILDVSGSMGWNSKIDNLKVAAKEFVDTVLTNTDPSRVAISIIPYNQQVYMPAALSSHLNLADSTVAIASPRPYKGALTQYQTRNPAAPCVAFDTADFLTRQLTASTSAGSSASFAGNYGALASYSKYSQPSEAAFWCGNHYAKILPYQNNPTVLKAYIDTLFAQGYTAIDYGMKWGVALLDPSMQPVVEGMADSKAISNEMRGKPAQYGTAGALKFVVLMTDGENTEHSDLAPEFKAGPTRIWFSKSAGAKNEYNGYYVEMPANSASQRWYVPGNPNSNKDDAYVSATSLPTDAVQLDYHALYRRFGVQDVAEFFFKRSDSAAYDAHRAAIQDVGGYDEADTNLKAICDEAKKLNQITVFTVAFEAPSNGEEVLKDCATAPGYYFDVEGTQISDAFSSIAGQISLLRLTE